MPDSIVYTDCWRSYNALDNIGVCSGVLYNIGGGMSNSISILELFSILESELDINLSYYVTPWRSNDQKVFVADTGKAFNDFLWKILKRLKYRWQEKPFARAQGKR